MIDENYRIREVAEIVQDVVPNCAIAFAPGASPDTRNYRVDFRKIAEALPSFKPSWTVRSGVEELYKAYTSAGLTSDDWTGWRYYRLQTIRHLQEAGSLTTACAAQPAQVDASASHPPARDDVTSSSSNPCASSSSAAAVIELKGSCARSAMSSRLCSPSERLSTQSMANCRSGGAPPIAWYIRAGRAAVPRTALR